MILYSPVQTEEELKGILELQHRNLGINLTPEEKQKEGFLTVSHSLDDLKKMHDIEPSIIAKENGTVIGYVLAMTAESKMLFPILDPMFALFDQIQFKGRPVSSYHYLVVGQTCIDKNYRGKGVFRKIYDVYIGHYRVPYDFLITEIATKNLRSMRAHQRIGFNTVHEYVAPDGVQWSIVLLDWMQFQP